MSLKYESSRDWGAMAGHQPAVRPTLDRRGANSKGLPPKVKSHEAHRQPLAESSDSEDSVIELTFD